jgi:two-component system, LuxR family, response regulator FixJ
MAGNRILVVDDEAMVLESLHLTLTHYGFIVETASSGAEALRKLSGARFELVVTDRKMPNMTGDELAAHIKQQDRHMPVMMLTGYPPEQKPAAVDSILLKPFSTAGLKAAVDALVKAHPDREPASTLDHRQSS